MAGPDQPGALVISLDLELHWGMRDRVGPTGQAAADLAASRDVSCRLARLFSERNIRATWAVVGMLFASTRSELERFSPSCRPRYRRPELDPYSEPVGENESDDPLHLAGSLVRELSGTPGQEIASHTYSHYYCLESPQDEQAWRSDLAAAQAIAAHQGLSLRSLVLPRNQWEPSLLDVLPEYGFDCVRAPRPGWANRPRPAGTTPAAARIARSAAYYQGLRPLPSFGWTELDLSGGVCRLPASSFLPPWTPGRRRLEPLRQRRLVRGLRHAIRTGGIFHLWWHPHNFVPHVGPNLDELARFLDVFAWMSARHGIVSLSMGDVADRAFAR